MNEQLKTPLQKVIGFLDEQGYRYAVIGGLAMAQWGICALHMTLTSKCSCPT